MCTVLLPPGVNPIAGNKYVYTNIKRIILVFTTNVYGAVEVWLRAFLTLTPDGGEVSAVYYSRFIPRKNSWCSLVPSL